MTELADKLKKRRIIESAGHYLCAETPDELYDEYLKLLSLSNKGNGNDLAADYVDVWEPLANNMTVAKLIETIENSVIVDVDEKMPELYKDIDWALLKEQKKTLLKVIEDCDNVPILEHLEGILVLIDSIQDDAVDNFGVDEHLVFDLHPEDDCEKDDNGNCIYCGEKCWEGQMCDEQQAGGFEDKLGTTDGHIDPKNL